MKLFHHAKRGQEHLYFVLFEIILIVLVTSIIFNKINDIRKDQIFQKKFLARDLALVKNVEYAAPGVLAYAYGKQAEQFPQFEITFADNAVSFSGTPYPYAANTNVFLQSEPQMLTGVKAIALVRSGRDQFISNYGPINPLRLQCGDQFERISGKITLDAGHGYNEALIERQQKEGASEQEIKQVAGDRGIITAVGAESELMRLLAASIYGHDPNLYGQTRNLKEDTALSLEERRRLIDGAVLSLHARTDTTLKAYIDAQGKKRAASEQLACAILSSLVDYFPDAFTGVSIIPIESAALAPDDPKQVLASDKPGVFLELGDMRNAETPMIKERRTFAQAINEAIQHLQRVST